MRDGVSPPIPNIGDWGSAVVRFVVLDSSWGGRRLHCGRTHSGYGERRGSRLWQVPLNRLLVRLPVVDARVALCHPKGTDLITVRG